MKTTVLTQDKRPIHSICYDDEVCTSWVVGSDVTRIEAYDDNGEMARVPARKVTVVYGEEAGT